MARPIEQDMQMAWKALSGMKQSGGWLSVAVVDLGGCKIRAARRFPENEEALLIGFALNNPLSSSQLPKGKGFRVEVVSDPALGCDYQWIGLVRNCSGSADIFITMVADLMRTLKEQSHLGQSALLSLMIGRIRAWQDFMSRARKELSPEAEVGLFGELVFLKALISEGVEPFSAVDSWDGPLRGLQDFVLGSGAVEVKTTIAIEGFPAKIGSLEQLDDSVKKPLYLCAVRLKTSGSGKTLPELANHIRDDLSYDLSALAEFDNRLLRAGLFEAHYESYKRHFSVVECKNLLVDGHFPRLIPATVPGALRTVRYELDLDQVAVAIVEPEEMYKQLGMM